MKTGPGSDAFSLLLTLGEAKIETSLILCTPPGRSRRGAACCPKICDA